MVITCDKNYAGKKYMKKKRNAIIFDSQKLAVAFYILNLTKKIDYCKEQKPIQSISNQFSDSFG